MKTAELTGAALDYWVARAEGYIPLKHGEHWYIGLNKDVAYSPSSDWGKAGPIIEGERIDIVANGEQWDAGLNARIESSGDGQSFVEWIEMDFMQSGSLPLIAAMRAYVCSKFGDTVPDEVTA